MSAEKKNIFIGDAVKRKNSYYRGITGKVIGVTEYGQAIVVWNNSTGATKGK